MALIPTNFSAAEFFEANSNQFIIKQVMFKEKGSPILLELKFKLLSQIEDDAARMEALKITSTDWNKVCSKEMDQSLVKSSYNELYNTNLSACILSRCLFDPKTDKKIFNTAFDAKKSNPMVLEVIWRYYQSVIIELSPILTEYSDEEFQKIASWLEEGMELNFLLPLFNNQELTLYFARWQQMRIAQLLLQISLLQNQSLEQTQLELPQDKTV